MSKGNAFENALLLLLFNNTDASGIGDATGLRGSSTAGSFYVSMHVADPDEGGDQTSNETAYGSYSRVAVERSGSGWTVSGNTVSNAGVVQFPQCTSGTETITHFAVGTDLSGPGKVLYKGVLSPSSEVTTGLQPQFAIGDLVITEE